MSRLKVIQAINNLIIIAVVLADKLIILLLTLATSNQKVRIKR
jgi:hypothetical protein